MEYCPDKEIASRLSSRNILERYSSFLDVWREYFKGISFHTYITDASKYFDIDTEKGTFFICRWDIGTTAVATGNFNLELDSFYQGFR